MLVDNSGAFGEGMCVVVGVDAGVLVGDVYGVVYLLRHLVLGVYVGMWGGEILMCWDRGRGKRGGVAGVCVCCVDKGAVERLQNSRRLPRRDRTRCDRWGDKVIRLLIGLKQVTTVAIDNGRRSTRVRWSDDDENVHVVTDGE